MRKDFKKMNVHDLKEFVVELEERLMDLIEVNANHDFPPFELEIFSVLREIERMETMIESKPVIKKK